MATPRLKVPLVLPLQEDAYSCVPRCIKMIFMYIGNSLEGMRVPDFDLERIGKIIETKSDGTTAENVPNLNKVKEIKTAIPSIKFEIDQKWHKLDEITEELNERQPPIAYIRKEDVKGEYGHAVLITCLDKENHRIYYNDPVCGEMNEDLSTFLNRWDDEDRVLIKVKIGKEPQRELEVYFKNVEKTDKDEPKERE